MADFLHPAKETVVAWHAAYPNMAGFIDMYAYWSYSVFYVFSEIWGSAILALAFWEFANHVVRFGESKRFYGLFAVIANFALIASGGVVYFCSESIKKYVPLIAILLVIFGVLLIIFIPKSDEFDLDTFSI